MPNEYLSDLDLNELDDEMRNFWSHANASVSMRTLSLISEVRESRKRKQRKKPPECGLVTSVGRRTVTCRKREGHTGMHSNGTTYWTQRGE